VDDSTINSIAASVLAQPPASTNPASWLPRSFERDKINDVAILRVAENNALADLVSNDIRQIDGITDTELLIGLRAHSQHDREKMFSIGMD